MARYYRLAWFDPDARSPDEAGHPLYVSRRQGRGRVDDPEHEYRVLYVATDPAGCVAEVFGDFVAWTPALLEPPPSLPNAVRAVIGYEIDATLCDLDDPRRLVELDLRPSTVVTHDRATTQRWARQIFDAGTFDGVSWWSRRDARWTSCGVWRHAGARVQNVDVLPDLDHPAVADAAAVLLRLRF